MIKCILKAGGRHFEFWRIVYYVVQMTKFFCVKCLCDAFCRHFVNVRSDLCGHRKNLVILPDLKK